MNYISIKEASSLTGKSEKTIRRFALKPESKAYTRKEGLRILIEVNYLLSVYSFIKNEEKKGRQNMDIVQEESTRAEISELRHKLTLYEQEIKHKESLIEEKEHRIIDLQKSLLLLEYNQESNKKKGFFNNLFNR